jgi:transposase-like protein
MRRPVKGPSVKPQWAVANLWRAVDAEGEVLDVLVHAKKNKRN